MSKAKTQHELEFLLFRMRKKHKDLTGNDVSNEELLSLVEKKIEEGVSCGDLLVECSPEDLACIQGILLHKLSKGKPNEVGEPQVEEGDPNPQKVEKAPEPTGKEEETTGGKEVSDKARAYLAEYVDIEESDSVEVKDTLVYLNGAPVAEYNKKKGTFDLDEEAFE